MSYSFPVLKYTDIANALSQLSIGITEAELNKPSHDTIRPALESLVELLVGVSRSAASSAPVSLSFIQFAFSGSN